MVQINKEGLKYQAVGNRVLIGLVPKQISLAIDVEAINGSTGYERVARVLSVGPHVTQCKEGDWVDFSNELLLEHLLQTRAACICNVQPGDYRSQRQLNIPESDVLGIVIFPEEPASVEESTKESDAEKQAKLITAKRGMIV